MTEPAGSNGDFSRDEMIAAEYVLGVLSFEGRQQVEKRLRFDDGFALKVREWENRLSGLNEDYVPAAPNETTYAAIESRLFSSKNARIGVLSSLWGSLSFWRGISALTTAGAAIAVAIILLAPLQPPARMSYMAELSSPDDPMALMVAYDASSGRMAIKPMAAGERSQKSLELWLVEEDGTPYSLGLVDPNTDADMIVPAHLRDQLRNGMTLAVSVEPYGGSPTGKPTGPVIASGTTRKL